jgi:hypothetical protein
VCVCVCAYEVGELLLLSQGCHLRGVSRVSKDL